jgi:hypothetical protein
MLGPGAIGDPEADVSQGGWGIALFGMRGGGRRRGQLALGVGPAPEVWEDFTCEYC